MRLHGYYFGFVPTGNDDIDRILSAVACAGKAFHSTEFWSDDGYEPWEPTHRGSSCIEWIQNAALDAAAKVAADRADADAYRALRAEAEAALAYGKATGMKIARPPRMSPATVSIVMGARPTQNDNGRDT